jgi:hypothetical protein
MIIGRKDKTGDMKLSNEKHEMQSSFVSSLDEDKIFNKSKMRFPGGFMNYLSILNQKAAIVVILCLGCAIAAVGAGLIAPACNNSSIAANSKEMGEAKERIVLEGVVGINDTTTGCWYLSTDEGHVFEPIFCVTGPFELKQGLRLRVYGYVEPDAPQTCSFGPVFYAEQTQIIGQPDSPIYYGSK